MKIACSLAFIALAASSLAALADDDTGRVRGLYVEVSRGVLVDPRMSRNAGARRWADVELIGAMGERRRTLVMVPPETNVAVGDLVGVRLAPERRQIASLSIEPLPAVSRVTRVEPGSQLALPGN